MTTPLRSLLSRLIPRQRNRNDVIADAVEEVRAGRMTHAEFTALEHVWTVTSRDGK